ncbi:ABC transporter ATP-binding protein [Microbacterium sp. cf332]|uniref:ABC transporter ATP-binding protein n=1 Tax=Microbacterium sp. cf332 TaxID=1761804 RepID=UPI00088D0984|nr:ATP-binding cassette domain-containing protein [Microbacterium sp. cf332]SDQ62247.1 energy-coupling factor transport system ATP-binding protein [Microbacterium sp. cf332]
MTSAASGAATAGTPVSATAPAPLLAVRDLAVTYEGSDVAATRGATFTVTLGEVVLLLGPSGSGKSTIALTLNGLIPQSVPAAIEGSVLVDGQDAATTPIPQLSTRVGMVFQDPDAQLVTGTLLDEVAFGPENLRLPVDEVLARAERALRRVGLWERRHENPDRLSGGGRQRLAIACALAMDSPLLVLDEPTANLDPEGIEDVYAAIGEIAASGDRAILLVEHNLDAAIGFTDRVVALDHAGRTVADGRVDSVLRDRAAELHDLGVWLPVSTLAALRLREAGYALEPLPLTPEELRAGLVASASVSAREPRSIARTSGAAADPVRDASDHPTTASAEAAPARRGAVSVRDLTLQRGRTSVLHGIDLDVRPGEFVAIVGANGAGKTSLLQAIAGVVRAPRGRIDVGGLDPSRADARALARCIGFVFQNPEHQFVAHTVFDELAHSLRRQQLSPDEIRDRVDDMLRRFGLTAHADRHPFLLSGGQKRRLSVGTALIAGAPVLALDEPTFGQDRARADELLQLLRDLNAEGATILVVTHDMQLVSDYAERCVVVGAGRIMADGRSAAVLGDDALLRSAALRMPPLRRALHGLDDLPELSDLARLADLPRGRG